MSLDLAVGHRNALLYCLALLFVLLRKLVFELFLLLQKPVDLQVLDIDNLVFLSDDLVLLFKGLVNLFILSFHDFKLLILLLACLVNIMYTNLK